MACSSIWYSHVCQACYRNVLLRGRYEGFANIVDVEPRPNANAPNNSQPYIAEVATLSIITIQADNQEMGLMAAVFVGMCEVSSCEFFVKSGDRVKKGDSIGTSHFGGSTHCLVIRPETT